MSVGALTILVVLALAISIIGWSTIVMTYGYRNPEEREMDEELEKLIEQWEQDGGSSRD